MLQNWGMEGYIRWLRGIKSQYKQRRDWICDAFEDVFHIEVSSGGLNTKVMDVLGYGTGVTCYAPPKAGTAQAKWDEKKGATSTMGKPLVSFIPPTGEYLYHRADV
jgi:aromatic amino acid aminotransferase I